MFILTEEEEELQAHSQAFLVGISLHSCRLTQSCPVDSKTIDMGILTFLLLVFLMGISIVAHAYLLQQGGTIL